MNIENHHMIIEESWENFTEEDHNIWNFLFQRQAKLLDGRASSQITDSISKLNICNSKIPRLSEITKILEKETNFSIVPVKGFIEESLFFRLLSIRKFPSTCFIRKRSQLDYIKEPDIFHDVFGHIPLLINPIFADFMQEFGKKGLEAIEAGMLEFAAALYWFTVEFGLINSPNGARIYGAGLISSAGESVYSLDSNIPKRVKFDILEAMNTKYRIDVFQNTYFVIESFNELFDLLHDINWKQLAKKQSKNGEIL